MKRYLAILVLLPLLAMGGRQQGMGPGPGMPASAGASHHFTVVQYGVCMSSGTGNAPWNTTCTLSTGLTAGDAILVVNPNTANFYSTTNSLGTMTIFPTTFSNYGNAAIITGGTAGTTSFTVIGVGGYQSSVVQTYGIAEVSGVNSAAPVEQKVGMANHYSISTTTGSVTTTGANDEVCGLVATVSGSTITTGTGYTALAFTGFTPASGIPFLTECSTAIVGPGTYNPPVTGTGNNFDEGTVAFTLN